ncbi:MAG: class II fructose-bisphosphate aldolase [Candidatus Liptonbacteria bacterium]|nr:class II fructose-bisphosphate aldolase [Candidatus Liptonbacteria bacterium]
MIITTKELFAAAYRKFSLGAYNINNLEQIVGLFRGNRDSKAPFIIQISKGARSYTDKTLLEALIRQCGTLFPDLLFAVHLDHGDEQNCHDSIDSGFYSSVMIDASMEPFEKNVEITKRVVEHAHAKGIRVEAEIGQLGGVEEHINVDEANAHLTDPAQAKEFVEKTGCDSLAVAVGTSHGAYKFSGSQKIHFNRLQEIAAALPGVPLVMHGSSSVPQDEVAKIEAAGGKLSGAKGVSEGDLEKVYEYGVVKINIDTDGRLIWTRVHREYFRDTPKGIDLRDPGKVFMQEYAKFIAHKNEIFGSANQLEAVRALL